MLKYALLGFLNYGPQTGYDLENWINHSTGNFWQARLSQIYTTLKKMEEDGAVVSHIEPQEGRPDRRVYTITDAGRADLEQWVAQPEVKRPPAKDELLLKLFFARPAGKDTILMMLRLQRNVHQQQLDRYRHEAAQSIAKTVEYRPEFAEEAIMWEATRQFGVRYEEMYIQWIDDTIAAISAALPGDSTEGDPAETHESP